MPEAGAVDFVIWFVETRIKAKGAHACAFKMLGTAYPGGKEIIVTKIKLQ